MIGDRLKFRSNVCHSGRQSSSTGGPDHQRANIHLARGGLTRWADSSRTETPFGCQQLLTPRFTSESHRQTWALLVLLITARLDRRQMGLFTEQVAAGVGRWPPTVVSGLAITPLVLIAFNKRRPQVVGWPIFQFLNDSREICASAKALVLAHVTRGKPWNFAPFDLPISLFLCIELNQMVLFIFKYKLWRHKNCVPKFQCDGNKNNNILFWYLSNQHIEKRQRLKIINCKMWVERCDWTQLWAKNTKCCQIVKVHLLRFTCKRSNNTTIKDGITNRPGEFASLLHEGRYGMLYKGGELPIGVCLH